MEIEKTKVKRMRLNSDLILRQVKDEYLIINPFSDTVDMTKVYTLNETAAWLWQQMEGKEFEVKDLTQAMLDEYEVDEETAHKCAEELAKQWVETGLATE